jgi:hypothetical protein
MCLTSDAVMLCAQVRIATRLGTPLVSSDFKSRDYYPNIRKAITAGYFMQACCSLPCVSLLERHRRSCVPCLIHCVHTCTAQCKLGLLGAHRASGVCFFSLPKSGGKAGCLTC